MSTSTYRGHTIEQAIPWSAQDAAIADIIDNGL